MTGTRFTIATITARDKPMLQTMAASLEWAYRVTFSKPDEIEWLIVDAKLWEEPLERLLLVQSWVGRLPFPVIHLPPKSSKWHGPDRVGDRDLPDTNGARNTALIFASGENIVLLDDCSVVSPNFFKVLRDKPDGALNLWWERGDVYSSWAPRGDYLCKAHTPTCFRGSSVSYPVDRLVAINGWDEIFSGSRSGNDVEAAVRLARSGCPMWIDFRAGVCEAPHPPIFDRTSYFTEKNDDLLEQVINDETWIQARGNDFSVAERRTGSEAKALA